MWDLPRPGLEPVSPALAGRFSTTAPRGKPKRLNNFNESNVEWVWNQVRHLVLPRSNTALLTFCLWGNLSLTILQNYKGVDLDLNPDLSDSKASASIEKIHWGMGRPHKEHGDWNHQKHTSQFGWDPALCDLNLNRDSAFCRQRTGVPNVYYILNVC